jgi:hypothetical protein
VFDAFSSDAIPVHLITREALVLYLSRLAPRGVLAFHISNRHLDLGPVLGNLARDQGLAAVFQNEDSLTSDETANGKVASTWLVMARRPDDLGSLIGDSRWIPAPTSTRAVWTDDYSNIVSALNVLKPQLPSGQFQ